MSCTNDFTLTKGIDNIFTFTIKQSGTTLPIEIIDNKINKLTSITPEVTYVPYQAEVAYVPAKAEVLASPGQEYIPTVEGKVEKYNVYANALLSGSTYELQINSTTIAVLYSSVTYSDKYEYLIAIKNAINASAVNTVVVAVVDANILKISGLVDGVSYTLNGSDILTITEIQLAQTAVVGQPYIAPIEYAPAVAEVSYSAAVEPHYLATNTPLTVDITELLTGLSIVKIEIQPEVSINSLEVGAVAINLVNNWYDIGTSTDFVVTPVTNNEELSEALPSISLKVRVTLVNTVDTFNLKLFSLDLGEIALEIDATPTANGSVINIVDALGGKIEVVFNKDDLANLVAEKGTKVDRYYPKPSYSMIIDCNTYNNGRFPTKLDYVFVE